MSPPERQNAIERRLEYLTEIWAEFAEDGESRLLRWLTDQEGARMIDLFLQTQDEEISDRPELFVRLEVPFEDPAEYGNALIGRFTEIYEASREELIEEGIEADWACPPTTGEIPAVDAFARCCISFQGKYQDLAEKLVIVLAPAAVSDVEAWSAWLNELLIMGLPDAIRLTTIDSVETPQLELLAEGLPSLVMTRTPELDMPGAMLELAKEGGGEGPGPEFRCHFVETGNHAASGDLDRMEKSAEAALRIATQEGWTPLQVAVQVLRANSYLATDLEKSIEAYRLGREAAARAKEGGEPGGAKLVVQCQLGEAAAFVGAGQLDDAAPIYEQAAAAAVDAEDPLMVVESWRMAGYCYHQKKKTDDAWRCGWEALHAAEGLDEETRKNSTLPYVGQSLLKLSKSSAYRGESDAVQSRMIELLGDDWETRVES